MIYTFADGTSTQTFEGFRRYDVPETLGLAENVIIVEFDGDYDLYVVNCPFGIEELQRFYRMKFNVDSCIVGNIMRCEPLGG